LLKAALVTPGWGGEPGCRPSWVLTSEFGRGTGKTATATAIGKVWGGVLSVKATEDFEQVTKRLLGDDGYGSRCILIDNIRGRLANGDLEGLITADSIDGWRPYHGQFSRPNYLTWYFTANSPRLSTDITQRAVVVHIGRPRHEQAFVEWANTFIRENQGRLIADIMAFLAGPTLGQVSRERIDRWQSWQRGVLGKFANADDLAGLIIERREQSNADDEDAENAARAIGAHITRTRGIISEPVKLTREEMRNLLVSAKVLPDNMNVNGTHTWLADKIGVGPLASLADGKTRADGRVWVWTPPGDDIPI
jgi:hypothetical protein